MFIPHQKKTILAGLALSTILLTTVAPGINQTHALAAQEVVRSNDEFYTSISEDMEIMERILNKSLQEHYAELRAAQVKAQQEANDDADDQTPDEDDTAAAGTAPSNALGGFYRTAGSNYDSLISYNNGYIASSANFNFDNYYIPSAGVVYTLDFSVAVKEEEQPEAEVKDDEPELDEEENLWRETESQVRNNPSNTAQILARTYNLEEREPDPTYVIDQAALDNTVDVIINAIGKYGAKIDDLSQGESIIIVAKVSGSLNSINVERNPIRWRYLHADTPRQRLVLSFPVAELKKVAAGQLDVEDLKNRIGISMYDDSPTASSNSPFGQSQSIFMAPSTTLSR